MPTIVDYLSGYTNQGTMHDYAHASRLYLDDTFALAPKTSWIYYVVFSINPAAISEVQWNEQKRGYEAGMLVKACDLPKFKIQIETLNQYNRKTKIQQKITYEPISMTFHDDMSNVTNSLWVNYFRYYYRDTWHGQTVRTANQLGAGDRARADYGNTKYSSGPTTASPDGRPGGHGKFGLNNNQSVPFFNAVTLYQLNAKRFTSYILVNPLIENWEHDQLDQNQGSKFAQSKCTLGYETVFYGEGRVARDNPSGFATFHYDLTPSPLSIAGGGNSTIFGPGGILSGTQDLFGTTDKLLSGNSISSLGSLASIGIMGSNLVRNYKNISDVSLRAEGQNILNSAIKGAIGGGGPGSGLLGGIIGGGLGSLGKSLGFGPQVGTLLDGANFVPNSTEAVAGAVGEPSPTSGPGPSAGAAISASQLVLQGDDLEKLGTDPALLNEALAEQNALQNDLNAKYTTAQLRQSEVEAAVAKATAADGPQAGILVREQYARDGYRSPDQYGAQLQAVADNKSNIQNVIDTVARQDAASLDADAKQDIAFAKEAAEREAKPPTFIQRTIAETRKKYEEYKEVFTRTPVELYTGAEKDDIAKELANRPFWKKIPFFSAVPLDDPDAAARQARIDAEVQEYLREASKKKINN
jgi:hypothetical protein